MRVADRYPLRTAATALEAHPDSGFWLLQPASLVHLSGNGAAVESLPVPVSSGGLIIGVVEGGLLLGAGTGFYLIASDGTVTRMEGGGGPALLTADRRWVLAAAAQGDLVAYDTSTGRPTWGWPSEGSTVTALAASPEGDRVYHAVQTPGGEGSLLIRDMQSGRTLRRVDLENPLRQMEVSAEGSVYGLAWGEGDEAAEVVRLDWEAGELQVRWEAGVDLAGSDSARLELSGRDSSIAVLVPENETGLTILNGETGDVIHRFSGSAIDLSFDEQGRIVLLTGPELLRLENR